MKHKLFFFFIKKGISKFVCAKKHDILVKSGLGKVKRLKQKMAFKNRLWDKPHKFYSKISPANIVIYNIFWINPTWLSFNLSCFFASSFFLFLIKSIKFEYFLINCVCNTLFRLRLRFKSWKVVYFFCFCNRTIKLDEKKCEKFFLFLSFRNLWG